MYIRIVSAFNLYFAIPYDGLQKLSIAWSSDIMISESWSATLQKLIYFSISFCFFRFFSCSCFISFLTSPKLSCLCYHSYVLSTSRSNQLGKTATNSEFYLAQWKYISQKLNPKITSKNRWFECGRYICWLSGWPSPLYWIGLLLKQLYLMSHLIPPIWKKENYKNYFLKYIYIIN